MANRKYIFSVFILLCSCNMHNDMGKKDYVRWALNEHNGLVKKQTIGDWTVQVTFLPIPLLVIKDFGKSDLEAQLFTRKIKEKEGMYYFELKLIAQEGKLDVTKFQVADDHEYEKRLNYFSFGIKRKIWVENKSKKQECSLLNYEASYGLQKTATLNCAFAKSKFESGDLTFVYDAEEIGIGILRYTFDAKTIKSIPKLKI